MSLTASHEQNPTAFPTNTRSGRSAARQSAPRRAGFPGEHWLVFAAALGLFQLARRTRSSALRWAAGTAASALFVRSVSGSEGILQTDRSRGR